MISLVVGEKYNIEDIAEYFGYKKSNRSLQGGIFSKNENVILLNKKQITLINGWIIAKANCYFV